MYLVTSTGTMEAWHYIEVTNLGNGSFRTRAYPLATPSNASKLPTHLPSYNDMPAASLAELGKFYDWEESSTATVYATSLCGELLA